MQKCWACGAGGNLRHVVLRVDDEDLRMQPTFCEQHASMFLVRCGMLIGEMVDDNDEG